MPYLSLPLLVSHHDGLGLPGGALALDALEETLRVRRLQRVILRVLRLGNVLEPFVDLRLHPEAMQSAPPAHILE